LTENGNSTGLAAEVRALVAEVVGPTALEGIDDSTPLFERMVLDSLHLVAIVSELEQRFNVTIAPEDLVPDNFGSLSQMVHFIETRR
jgi:acyl carrier protein